MQPVRVRVEIGEDWRRPALQPVAVIAAAAEIGGEPDAGGDQRADPRIRRQQSLGVTLA